MPPTPDSDPLPHPHSPTQDGSQNQVTPKRSNKMGGIGGYRTKEYKPKETRYNQMGKTTKEKTPSKPPQMKQPFTKRRPLREIGHKKLVLCYAMPMGPEIRIADYKYKEYRPSTTKRLTYRQRPFRSVDQKPKYKPYELRPYRLTNTNYGYAMGFVAADEKKMAQRKQPETAKPAKHKSPPAPMVIVPSANRKRQPLITPSMPHKFGKHGMYIVEEYTVRPETQPKYREYKPAQPLPYHDYDYYLQYLGPHRPIGHRIVKKREQNNKGKRPLPYRPPVKASPSVAPAPAASPKKKMEKKQKEEPKTDPMLVGVPPSTDKALTTEDEKVQAGATPQQPEFKPEPAAPIGQKKEQSPSPPPPPQEQHQKSPSPPSVVPIIAAAAVAQHQPHPQPVQQTKSKPPSPIPSPRNSSPIVNSSLGGTAVAAVTSKPTPAPRKITPPVPQPPPQQPAVNVASVIDGGERRNNVTADNTNAKKDKTLEPDGNSAAIAAAVTAAAYNQSKPVKQPPPTQPQSIVPKKTAPAKAAVPIVAAAMAPAAATKPASLAVNELSGALGSIKRSMQIFG